MQFCKHRGPRKKAAGTQCVDRKWQSLKKWTPKELSNKQKFTRDVNESIRDYVFAFVCRTNWGNANRLKNLADLASKCWVPKKKRVRNACNTIWWWYPIELRINGLRVAQIPSKRPNQFFCTNQKCCKGSEFQGCLGLQTSKISGTVVPTWPCFWVLWSWLVLLFFGLVLFFLLLCHVSNLLFLIMRAAISSAVITIEFWLPLSLWWPQHGRGKNCATICFLPRFCKCRFGDSVSFRRFESDLNELCKPSGKKRLGWKFHPWFIGFIALKYIKLASEEPIKCPWVGRAMKKLYQDGFFLAYKSCWCGVVTGKTPPKRQVALLLPAGWRHRWWQVLLLGSRVVKVSGRFIEQRLSECARWIYWLDWMRTQRPSFRTWVPPVCDSTCRPQKHWLDSKGLH